MFIVLGLIIYAVIKVGYEVLKIQYQIIKLFPRVLSIATSRLLQ
jgi:hypothetical protein